MCNFTFVCHILKFSTSMIYVINLSVLFWIAVHLTLLYVFRIWYLTNYSLSWYTKELIERSLLLLSLSLFSASMLEWISMSLHINRFEICRCVWWSLRVPSLVTILSQWRLQFYMNISCCWNWNLVFPVCVFVNKRIKAFCVITLKILFVPIQDINNRKCCLQWI